MPSKNVDTIRAMHESLNRHDTDAALAHVADNCTYVNHVTGPDSQRSKVLRGKQEFKELLQSRAHATSDAKVSNARYIDAGDVVIAEFTVEGTNDGPIGMGKFPPSHRRLTFDVCEIWRFDKNGRITSGSSYFDVFTILSQAGHLEDLSRVA
jgi:steroid delta-isomerase-like uncharacterized protein